MQSPTAQVTVTVTGGGSAGYAQLQISKLVQDQSYATGYSTSVNAYQNDTVSFKITVSNIGTAAATSAYLTDSLPSGLSYQSGTTLLNGARTTDITSGNLSLGSLSPNQQEVVTFSATVSSYGSTGTTIQNTASATASNAYQVQASATVFVQAQNTGSVNITESKSAYNNSLGVNATQEPAQPGNVITYTLTATNTGTAQAAGYVVTDSIGNVLQFATVTSANGGSVNGSAISWPAQTIAPGQSVSDTFQVTVQSTTSYGGSEEMVNTFGNTVTIQLANVQPIYVQQPPQTIYVQSQPQVVYEQQPPVYVQPQPTYYVQPTPTVVPQQPTLQYQQPTPQVLGMTFVAPKTGADSSVAFGFAGFVTTAQRQSASAIGS